MAVFVTGHRNTFLQRTETLFYSAHQHFVTAHINTLLQRTETRCYNAQKHFVTAHRNTLLQRTETRCYSAHKHFVKTHRNTFFTGHRNTLLQRTETLSCKAKKKREEKAHTSWRRCIDQENRGEDVRPWGLDNACTLGQDFSDNKTSPAVQSGLL
jgi:hypothetical protein